ncbi:MAG: hypothetical protein QXH51_07450 [Candidatus Bathyarchaeia archaeon]
MARKKKIKPTTEPRYRYKMARQFSIMGFSPESELVKSVASASTNEWSRRFGVYEEMYEKLKEKFGDRIPRAQLGIYRSGLFKIKKAAETGEDVDAVIESYARKSGIDAGLLREIAAFFGLIETASERQG